MNLLKEIEIAQRKARIDYDTFGGHGGRDVFEAMTEEAQKAWRKANLPDSLLVSSNLSQISSYAKHCGITLPAEEEQEVETHS